MIQWQRLCSYDLSDERIHVWLIDVNDHGAYLSRYIEYLTDEECTRAERFKFDRDRNCFIISRASLRVLLSRYLKCFPGAITFHTNQYGKPALVLSGLEVSVQFNLSHSHDRALVAVVESQDVGVDIEYMQERLALREIVARYFSANEYAEFEQLPEAQRLQGFYNIWTRKEAFTKAIGQGILYPLNQFEVSLDPHKKAKVIAVNGNKKEAALWHLYGFTVDEQYCAAVSWKGHKKDLAFYKFLGDA